MSTTPYSQASTADLHELLKVNAQDTQAAVRIRSAKERKARLAELRSIRNKINTALNNR